MARVQRKILSVGGSIIIPHEGFDVAFLKAFKAMIMSHIKKGETFILTIGGGGTCRQYQQAAQAVTKLTNEDLDWIGIHSTIFNAQFVRHLFKDVAYKDVVTNPTVAIKTNKPIIVAAGWKPGCSTDHDAVLLAKTYDVTDVLNLSNIEYVYDKDPRIHPEAQKIERISWASFRKDIVGSSWTPGKSAPFDPIASQKAQKLGLRVSIVNGKNLAEVEKALRGKSFQGTIIE